MNRLAGATSPYLRQHADNPVDWYEWGEEAFAAARSGDRPILLSVGYSACHWCHVMAHESFEDEETASLMNTDFVNIKVDREERPDVDSVYMEAVQSMSGSGGWPMTVFLAPDGRPFFAGTYFPADPSRGRPTFKELLAAISDAWAERRPELLEQADALSEAVTRRLDRPADDDGRAAFDRSSGHKVGASLSAAAVRLGQIHDEEWGGFGRAPKFPQAPLLELLLRRAGAGSSDAERESALGVVDRSLAAMASGGIYDHLGGGFARYSVDRTWLVPHFEKMLYDQAALTRLYVHGWQLTGDPRWRQVVDETVDYVLRDLREESGGVHSAEDADSEGEEGLYYLWTRRELDEVLGATAGDAASWWGVSDEGNFEGRNILRRPLGAPLERPADIEDARRLLLATRERRIRPGRDDKVLTEWNAMWVSALAEAAAATDNAAWRDAAVGTAEFLLAELRSTGGRFMRSWKGGTIAHLAYASDYAWLTDCFVRLAELTGEGRYLQVAEETATDMLSLFGDGDGGLYSTGSDAEELIVRPRDLFDGVIPSATSVAAVALARLGAITGEQSYLDAAVGIVRSAGHLPWTSPTSVPHLLWGAELLTGGQIEVVVAGDRRDLVEAVQGRYLPSAVLAWDSATGLGEGPLWEGRSPGAAYVCRGGACLLPVKDLAGLASSIDDAVASAGVRPA